MHHATNICKQQAHLWATAAINTVRWQEQEWHARQALTWVAHIVDACGKDHGRQLQVSQLSRKVIIGQEAPQCLCHICCMYVVVIRIAIVCPLYILHWHLVHCMAGDDNTIR